MFDTSRIAAIAIGLSSALISASPASAITYGVQVYEASGVGQFTASTATILNFLSKSDLSTASFLYSGPLNFVQTGAQNSTNTGDLTSGFFGANAAGIVASSYVGTGPTTVAYGANGANFRTLAGFLNTSGSVANYGYGSLYEFTAQLGNYSGTNLTITHDDGISVYANGNLLSPVGTTTSGPTSAVTETVILPNGTTSYTIAYARENGSPSILTVAVPEPMSMGILGAGLVGMGLVRRRSQARAQS